MFVGVWYVGKQPVLREPTGCGTWIRIHRDCSEDATMDAEKAWNSQRILSEDAEEPSNSMARRGPKLTPWSRLPGREERGKERISQV